jgi:hypothetical protein
MKLSKVYFGFREVSLYSEILFLFLPFPFNLGIFSEISSDSVNEKSVSASIRNLIEMLLVPRTSFKLSSRAFLY